MPKIRKFILAVISSAIVMWLLAGIWHKLIMVRFYTEQTHASHEGTCIILLAYIILAVMMTYIYPLGYRGKPHWLEGLRFGMLMGLLWVFPHDLVMAGAHNQSIIYVFKNAAWHIVEQGAGGIIVAVILGRIR